MPTIQELRDKRAGVWAQAQEYSARYAADASTMTAEDNAAWDRALSDVDTIGAEIERLERTAGLDKRFAEIDDHTTDVTGIDPAGDEYRDAFVAYMRHGLQDVTPEQRQLLQQNFVNMRDQGVTTGAGGGYTVPQGFWAKVTETMKYYGGVLQSGVETLDTDSGIDIPWPTNDDTSNTGALLSENTAASTQDLAFGQKSLGAYMYTSKMIKVSLQLLQDSGIDVEGFVAKKIGQRLGRIFNTHWTNGTGANQPQGFVTGATTGKTTASATAIIFEEIIDLIHSVDVAYRSSPTVGFQLHDLVLAYVRKLKDSQGHPLWQPSLIAGQPDQLFGYRYAVNNDMDSAVTSGKKTMAFGDFNAMYVARRVNSAQTLRLSERFADALQVAFLGFQRADGLVQDSSAAKLLVQA